MTLDLTNQAAITEAEASSNISEEVSTGSVNTEPVATENAGEVEAQTKESKAKMVEVTQAELDRLRGAAKEAKREKEKQAQLAKEAEDARLAEKGEYQKLAEQKQSELEALQQKETVRVQQEQARSIAEQLRFRNPEIAYRLLDTDIDRSDVEAVEVAMKNLAKANAYLLKEERTRSGLPIDSDSSKSMSAVRAEEILGSKTGQELRAMSDEEFLQLQRAAASG